MKNETHSKTTGATITNGTCIGVHELIDWEIIQYRKAVDAHRLDLSQYEGRCVAWQEAEQDFNAVDRATMEEKWRGEYCGNLCPYRENCLMAAKFQQHRSHEHLSRVG